MCPTGHGSLADVPRFRALLCVFAVASCNYDWTYRPDGGTDAAKDGGGDPNDPGADPGVGRPCTLDSPCSSGQFCFFGDRSCGLASSKVGECVTSNVKCNAMTLWCACDRASTLTACDAQSKGLDVDETTAGGCNATTTFPCGSTACESKTQACVLKGVNGSCEPCTDGCKCFPSCKCVDASLEQTTVDCTQ